MTLDAYQATGGLGRDCHKSAICGWTAEKCCAHATGTYQHVGKSAVGAALTYVLIYTSSSVPRVPTQSLALA